MSDNEAENSICTSDFAMGACAWVRARGMKEFCAVANNDSLAGLRKDVEDGILPVVQALKYLDGKVQQFNDQDCALGTYWGPLYQSYADELRRQLPEAPV
ncbi:MAG: hypothetical protein Q8L37_05210 [Candidatus Gottesmanbacteria bacterium]|nr:hypothetical protein [Candidatus Gottesmanbacteria bacterium]